MRYSLVESLLRFWGGRSVDARIVEGLLASKVVGIAIFDPRLICVQANAEMARLGRITPAEMVGRSLEAILGGRRRDELSVVARVLASGQPALGRTIDDDGMQLRVDYQPLRGAGGRAEGVVVVAVDMLPQRRAEQALTERLAVSELISELSASFIDLDSSAIDGGIERAMRLIGERLALDGTHVGRLEEDREHWGLTHQWIRQGRQRPSRDELQHMKRGILGAVPRVLDNEPAIIANVDELSADLESGQAFFRSVGVKSMVAMPLLMNRVVEGFVAFTAAEPRDWPPEVLASLRLTAEILANALDRKRNDGALTERLAFEEALSQMATRFIAASIDAIDGAIAEALRVLGQTLHYERTAVFLIDNERMALHYEWCADGVRSFGESMANIPIKEFGWPVTAIAAGKVVNIDRRALPPGADNARRVLDRDGF